jgi:hypothetical protein
LGHQLFFLVDSLLHTRESLWIALLGGTGGLVCLMFRASILWAIWRYRRTA